MKVLYSEILVKSSCCLTKSPGTVQAFAKQTRVVVKCQNSFLEWRHS